jgi:hypothetical protein
METTYEEGNVEEEGGRMGEHSGSRRRGRNAGSLARYGPAEENKIPWMCDSIGGAVQETISDGIWRRFAGSMMFTGLPPWEKDYGQVICHLVTGKTQIAPKLKITIPRMELVAAVNSVR